MKHPETFSTNPNWYTKLTNSFPLMLDDKYILSNGIAWLFKENNKWVFIPRLTGNAHQYFNAVLFIRLALPPSIFLQIRFTSNRLFQFGIGWKLSGRFAVHFRFQTDASAAAGYHVGLPNTDQASGFNYGGH
jgi:hypothetical protein